LGDFAVANLTLDSVETGGRGGLHLSDSLYKSRFPVHGHSRPTVAAAIVLAYSAEPVGR